MNADIKRRRCGIEVLAVAKTLNSARLAFTSSMSRAFITSRREAAVGDRELRGVLEQRDMPIQGGRPQGALCLATRADLVIGDELGQDHRDPPECMPSHLSRDVLRT